jgi:hypothetical protein
MPGSEFRILPSLPWEYKKYRTILPNKLGIYMTKGWKLIASLHYNVIAGENQVIEATRFLIGKGLKASKDRGSSYSPSIISLPSPKDPKGVIEPQVIERKDSDLADAFGKAMTELMDLEQDDLHKPESIEAETETDTFKQAMDELLDARSSEPHER